MRTPKWTATPTSNTLSHTHTHSQHTPTHLQPKHQCAAFDKRNEKIKIYIYIYTQIYEIAILFQLKISKSTKRKLQNPQKKTNP